MILALAVYLLFVTHWSGKRLQNIWMLVYYAATDSLIVPSVAHPLTIMFFHLYCEIHLFQSPQPPILLETLQ